MNTVLSTLADLSLMASWYRFGVVKNDKILNSAANLLDAAAVPSCCRTRAHWFILMAENYSVSRYSAIHSCHAAPSGKKT